MRGCFKNFFAMIGCFVLFIFSLLLLWVFWPQITDFVEERLGATKVEFLDSDAPGPRDRGKLASVGVGAALGQSPAERYPRWVG